jgi:hypothetical protein
MIDTLPTLHTHTHQHNSPKPNQKHEHTHIKKTKKPDQKGVLIRRLEPTAAVASSASPYDILLSFDGVNVANDGEHNVLCFAQFLFGVRK